MSLVQDMDTQILTMKLRRIILEVMTGQEPGRLRLIFGFERIGDRTRKKNIGSAFLPQLTVSIFIVLEVIVPLQSLESDGGGEMPRERRRVRDRQTRRETERDRERSSERETKRQREIGRGQKRESKAHIRNQLRIFEASELVFGRALFQRRGVKEESKSRVIVSLK
jgi:hypothetical protein